MQSSQLHYCTPTATATNVDDSNSGTSYANTNHIPIPVIEDIVLPLQACGSGTLPHSGMNGPQRAQNLFDRKKNYIQIIDLVLSVIEDSDDNDDNVGSFQ